jgi:hypothetical protein
MLYLQERETIIAHLFYIAKRTANASLVIASATLCPVCYAVRFYKMKQGTGVNVMLEVLLHNLARASFNHEVFVLPSQDAIRLVI